MSGRLFDTIGGVPALLLRLSLMPTTPSFVPLVLSEKATPIAGVPGRGWRPVLARAGSHPGRRRGPLSEVDLPPERWP